MCGIAGFTHSARSFDEAVIRRMTASLTHRGPDQQRCFSNPDVALGAVRLQVIDLVGGEQPFVTEDGQTVIVYNGEIYNASELRKELEGLGHRFRSVCDTEVALHAFVQWDTDCFRRFRGMFAMALWSAGNKRLVLCRDRMGIKPLYIRALGRDIIFGSELKALFAHPRVSRTLDLNALQDYLSLNYIPGPRTLVEGIEKLPPGHYLEWRSGVATKTRWWNPSLEPDSTLDENSAAEELDRLLRESVREHMVSDVPLGVWSSGGLDSSTLLHYAAELGGKPPKTFSIAFDSKSCDEREWFREISRVYGTEHHELELSRRTDLIPAIEDMANYSDEPGADAGALPMWFLSRMSRKHVTVALSGEGGDELFGGYLTYRADKLAEPLRRVPESWRRGALSAARCLLPVSNEKIGFEYKLKRWLEGSMLHPDEAHLFWNGSFSMEQKMKLLPRMDGQRLFHLYAGLPDALRVGSLNRYMLVDQHNYLPDNLLYKVDRMSMAHSLEVRPPLLDHRIVEFSRRLPERLKIRGGNQKAILKRVMKGRLPEGILKRRKRGLDIPAHEWFRGPLLPFLRETLHPDVVRRTNLFDAGYTQRLIRDHRDKRINAGYQLWALLTLFLWLKRWNIEIPPARGQTMFLPSEALAAAN
jgi:asparagine synthase (glutamine-hydrolysing)